MTVGSEFEGVKPTPPGVGQRLEVRGSKKEARGFDPPTPPANRTLHVLDIRVQLLPNTYRHLVTASAGTDTVSMVGGEVGLMFGSGGWNKQNKTTRGSVSNE